MKPRTIRNLADHILTKHFPMTGMNLIAASAGTGKTFSIQTLYLRLVLLHKLPVQQILVVTFTKAATQELRARLQQVLRATLDTLDGKLEKPEERITQLLACAEDSEKARSLIQQALLDFDLAAIFTIHGFCQRMLARFAFETGQYFNAETTEDAREEIQRACHDWWRKNIYPLDALRAEKILLSPSVTPNRLIPLTIKRIQKHDAQLYPPPIRFADIDWCADLTDPMRSLQIVNGIADEIATTYREQRPHGLASSFDDFLLNLRSALQDTTRGPQLCAILRHEFRAAMIDEFQDTDPIQWGIFQTLFADQSMPCFLVGDPKQAIYRFRNGDIQTYLDATRKINASYDLIRNYRSEQRIIDAINQLFIDRQTATFQHEQITYATPLEAAGKPREKSLLVNGDIDPCPFKIWSIPHRGTQWRLPGAASETMQFAYALCARGIANLLSDTTTTLAGAPVRPKHIAVLVMTHDEAHAIAAQLKALRIPVVQQGTGNVWSTPEAQQLALFLEVILNPQMLSTVRRALLSPWIGLTETHIDALNSGQRCTVELSGNQRAWALQDWVVFFEEQLTLWRTHGFPALFQSLFHTFSLPARFVATVDGLRSHTNLTQCGELLHQAILAESRSPEMALHWVKEQLENPENHDDAKLRQDSDDDAVSVMTVYTSKGLEFPIVFAPTLLRMPAIAQNNAYFEYHADHQLILSTDAKGKNPESLEVSQEALRKIYVALTRAVHRTVLFALELRPGKEPLNPLGDLLGHFTDSAAFAQRFGADPAIAVTAFSELPDVPPYAPAPTPQLRPPPTLPTLDRSQGHSSFSALSPKLSESFSDPDSADHDEEASAQHAQPLFESDSIFAFPAGASTGKCWHAIFETLDFDAPPETLRAHVETQLDRFGFLTRTAERAARLTVTQRMVQRVLTTPLANMLDPDVHRLNQIQACDKCVEWEFNFSTPRDHRTTQAIRELLLTEPDYRPFVEPLDAWNHALPGGYLTGFIDLLYRYKGRYYIIDWKSNRLKGTLESFSPDGLREEMALHGYWLQYLIYTVAVHQYLRARLPDYNYATHFGGVHYLFLRGFDHATHGLYSDRPPHALIEALSHLLGVFA